MSWTNIFSLVAKKKFLLGAISILGIVLLISLPNRALQSDENWFGEQAYWLLHDGQVKLKSIPLIFNWDEYMPVHHKLLTWSGVVLIKLFGWSVYPLRLFVFALTLLTGFLIFKLSKIKETPFSYKHVLLSFFILLITPEFVVRVFFFRPEILVMFFGMGAYYFLNKFNQTHQLLFAALSGVFSGLAFVSHLNALIFPITGFIILLIYKQWRGLIAYSIICFGVCLIYTEGLWNLENLEQYIYELKNWPSHSFKDKVEGGVLDSIWNNIKGLLGEHKRYFWDQNVWLVSALFFLSLIFHFKYIKSKEPLLLIYVLTLMITMGLVSGGHAPRYLMYIFPFMAMIISYSLFRSWETKNRLLQSVFLFIIIAQVVLLSLAYHKIFTEKINHVENSNEILGHVAEGSSVIGPWDLIYNNIGNYDLYNYKSYEYLEEKMETPFSQIELLKDLNRRKVDYIIIDELMRGSKEFHWFSNWEIDDSPYYERHYSSAEYIILKRKAP